MTGRRWDAEKRRNSPRATAWGSALSFLPGRINYVFPATKNVPFKVEIKMALPA